MLLAKWGFKVFSLREFGGPGFQAAGERAVILTFDDGYQGMSKFAAPVLKEFGARATFFVLGDRHVTRNIWDDPMGRAAVKLLSDEDILALQAEGHEIGSHSLTHKMLTKISTTEAEIEIRESKDRLQELLNDSVKSFAYPNGATNPALENIVMRAGYDFGCGVFSGPPKFGMNYYDIRRIPMTKSTGSFEFALKLLAPYEYYAWMRWNTGKVFRKFMQKDAEEIVYSSSFPDKVNHN